MSYYAALQKKALYIVKLKPPPLLREPPGRVLKLKELYTSPFFNTLH
jgi:hypothetical protein